MSGILWLVGTPIGNLGDLSPRAAQVLSDVDLVAAEDTRRSGRLLSGIGLSKPLVSYFEGNERERAAELLARLMAGGSVALVTDGGMPSISDPGFRLVRLCTEAGVEVRVVPGPSAAIAALAISGLPTDRFVFEGFLSKKQGERARRLEALKDDERTLILFESPRRLSQLMDELLAVFGDRSVAIARELTKLHEQVIRGHVSEMVDRFDEVKGEVVVVVAGASAVPDVAEAIQEAREMVSSGARKRDAARAVADSRGVSSNALYRALTEEQSDEEGGGTPPLV
jgi:16S rRNA (cytidine1402-2'-O)-methyltransferase